MLDMGISRVFEFGPLPFTSTNRNFGSISRIYRDASRAVSFPLPVKTFSRSWTFCRGKIGGAVGVEEVGIDCGAVAMGEVFTKEVGFMGVNPWLYVLQQGEGEALSAEVLLDVDVVQGVSVVYCVPENLVGY